MRLLPVRQVGRVHAPVRQVPSLPEDKVLQQRVPEERVGLPPPLVRSSHLARRRELFPNHLFPHKTYRRIVAGRSSTVAYCTALGTSITHDIFEGFNSLMSVTNTGIPNTTHTTTTDCPPLFFYFELEGTTQGSCWAAERHYRGRGGIRVAGTLTIPHCSFFFLLCCDAFFGERTDGRALGVGL